MPAALERYAFKPGQSGNLAGRPQGDGKLRKLLNKTLAMSAKQAELALCRRWASVKYVQDMAEFLAKLEGEMSKETDGGKGVTVILLNNQGAHPLDPDVFRERLLARDVEGVVLDTRPTP